MADNMGVATPEVPTASLWHGNSPFQTIPRSTAGI